jgi:hypothetical protein
MTDEHLKKWRVSSYTGTCPGHQGPARAGTVFQPGNLGKLCCGPQGHQHDVAEVNGADSPELGRCHGTSRLAHEGGERKWNI